MSQEQQKPVVVLDTSMGEIHVELDPGKAPITVENFLRYTRNGHYDGTIFHRVMPDFMIQGGGMTADMREKSASRPIKNEAANGLGNARGTIAMARTSVVDSATAQFFINHRDNTALNHRNETAQGFGYAVFGRVVQGMDVVDQIARVSTGNRGGHQNVPVQPVVINSARVRE